MRAYSDFSARHLSHNLGILDALIAETAVGLDVKLATFNEGHYSGVAVLQSVRPYER
jgi:predicted nucleic acid-binding protein